jgi:tRNA-dihydrouridine synthase
MKIPVLGSGDLFSPLDVHKYLQHTNASGVILARGAIHNPAIFRLKEKMLQRHVPLAEIDEDDWSDNTVQPEKPDAVVAEEVKTDGKKKVYDEESVEFSTNLVKVYERRYNRMPMEVDILDQVKDYFRLSITSGNNH